MRKIEHFAKSEITLTLTLSHEYPFDRLRAGVGEGISAGATA